MKRSFLGAFQLDVAVGLVVVLSIALFTGILVNAGLVKDLVWPPGMLRLQFPKTGAPGLAIGAEIVIVGTRAGEVRRIEVDYTKGVHAYARIEHNMKPFVRKDSTAVVHRQFMVFGPAYVEISGGTDAEVDWSQAVLWTKSAQGPTQTVDQLLGDVREKLIPLMERMTATLDAVKEPLDKTLSSAARITRRVEGGESLVRLIASDGVAKDLEATVADARKLTNDLTHVTEKLKEVSNDPSIGRMLHNSNALLASLQTTMRNIEATTPKITSSVTATTETLPATLLQAQIAARELELLLGQLRQSWLFGGSGSSATPQSRRAPTTQVRP